jgi:hypothetical protein
MILGDINFDYNVMERIRAWIMPKVELHIPFENIPNEKKNMAKLALTTAIMIFNNFIISDKTYELSVSLQYSYINEI